MSAFDPDDDEDELPERIIVVREPVGSAPGELEALAAEVAAADDVTDPEDEATPAIELDVPDDPEQVEAELEALVAEVAAVEESPPEPDIDLDEVDLRAEHEPLEADQAWLDALAADDDETIVAETIELDDDDEEPEAIELEDDDEEPEAIELEDDGEDLAVLAAEVASEQVELDLEEDRQVLDALATEVAERHHAADDELPTIAAMSRPERDETGPGTLRPKVPEPVIAARTIAPPSRSRRLLRRARALVGLLIVVVLAGVGLAGAIGAAVLLVVLVLSRAFGSGP